MRITRSEECHIDFNGNYLASNSAAMQIEGVFYKFMGYLISWFMISSIILCRYHLSDHSTAAMRYTLLAFVAITLLSFGAAFWTLCANWVSTGRTSSRRT